MLAPAMLFTATNQVRCHVEAGGVHGDVVNGGFGFMSDGRLCFDTNAPVGNDWNGGFRISHGNAVYATGATAGTDVWIAGLRVSRLGQVVFQVGAGVSFVNGNPLTAAGLLAVSLT